ncbi:MAG TPA: response regulator transcription factor [Verrucomicrobiae bacterium]|nr:response regulator transcription factor [Verrucomicrobiae bacterium]
MGNLKSEGMKVLLVEDDRKLGQFVRNGLEEVAYACVWVRNCQEAREAVARSQFDVIILDINLPDGTGLQLLTEWRRRQVPAYILILSARHEVDDRIAGLNLGADDYLAKPFSFGELLARIRSLVRRNSPSKQTVLEHRGIRVDLLTREVTFDRVPVRLTQREFALLEFFLGHPGRVLTRTQIAEKIWDSHFDMETNLVDVYVAKLRTKFRRPADPEPLFQTLRGVGYKLA